jgi:hypothetical protein
MISPMSAARMLRLTDDLTQGTEVHHELRTGQHGGESTSTSNHPHPQRLARISLGVLVVPVLRHAPVSELLRVHQLQLPAEPFHLRGQSLFHANSTTVCVTESQSVVAGVVARELVDSYDATLSYYIPS